jgi:hypothetical protein
MRRVSWVELSFFVAALAVLAACGDEVNVGAGGNGGTGADEGGAGPGGNGGAPPQGTSNKVDLLLVVDNSRSMADKQTILAGGVPQLVGFLTNPRCIDDQGITVGQPVGPEDECPAGSAREMHPVRDLHIGVISSSIGSHGADACVVGGIGLGGDPSVDDKAHLLTRSSTSGGADVPTYESLGFLAWDPDAEKMPPGESDSTSMTADLASLIVGAGEVGCGYEAPLEAWYRFLVDPDPYDSIVFDGINAVMSGTDEVLLTQRANFLRPDSVLMVVMLTDENDCSTRDGGQFLFVNQIFSPGTTTPFHLPKPRAACATDPNSDCCRSCGQIPGDGCDTSQDDCIGALASLDDNINVRCFDQKRRFGLDYMWPTDRYVGGLTAQEVSDRHGNVVKNPLFGQRDPSMVYLTGIVGVPWQDIARRDAGGAPDIATGLDLDGAPRGGYMGASELAATGTWDVIVGDPEAFVAPTDPLMKESIEPRAGANPVTGEALAPPGSGEGANSINGHEFSIPLKGDLQYACIFPLPVPKDCTLAGGQDSCDCQDPSNDSPLCDGTMQKYAKAYPAPRQLSVLKDLGSQGVVGSICPVQLVDGGAPGFAYQPTFGALVTAAAPAIAP